MQRLLVACSVLACVLITPTTLSHARRPLSGASLPRSTGAHRDRLLRQLRQQVEQALSTGQQWVRGSVALQQQMMHESLRQGAEVAQMLVAVFQRDGQETRQQAAQHFQATSAHLRRHDACLAAIQEQLAAVQQQQQQTAEQNAQFQQAWLAAQRQQMMAQQASATPQQSEAALPAANQPWR